jgi:hypothetical protein
MTERKNLKIRADTYDELRGETRHGDLGLDDAATAATDGGRAMRIECPRCGMRYGIPEDQGIEHWSCDCGESWDL